MYMSLTKIKFVQAEHWNCTCIRLLSLAFLLHFSITGSFTAVWLVKSNHIHSDVQCGHNHLILSVLVPASSTSPTSCLRGIFHIVHLTKIACSCMFIRRITSLSRILITAQILWELPQTAVFSIACVAKIVPQAVRVVQVHISDWIQAWTDVFVKFVFLVKNK